MPFVGFNMVLFVAYYFFLFKFYQFTPSFIDIIKIVAVSFTLGYLSPAPTGLGFKDVALVLLLVDAGLDSRAAFSMAIFDRGFNTLFWGILGSILGFDLIKEEFKKRFHKNIKK